MDKKEKCPDCGVAVGEPHKNECDVQRCSACGGQRISCDCETHDPLASVWTGVWPKRVTQIDLQLTGDPSETTRGSDNDQELSPDEQDFLRELEQYVEDDDQPQRHVTIKQRLLRYVAVNLNEVATHTASDALSDMLYDAHEQMAVDLLEPIFERSEFWTQRIAAELLGLSTDVEYDCEELVKEFEHPRKQLKNLNSIQTE
ncbi:MAG: hypothetical protein CME33_19775 [Gimesia sp.]|uniref:hypothetical protein n=1 Tax=Gimesia sp. TaxID=2024833 RepID=UPI000C56DF55|nr:hypothetical protein [Gimesia sp.]MAX38803.1 hypothetical protein [Gimesia sp.]|tara:strand:+ start:19889 stop:20491 length:603 start_codon:yes stop_codon:yes gene_type:complete